MQSVHHSWYQPFYAVILTAHVLVSDNSGVDPNEPWLQQDLSLKSLPSFPMANLF